MRPCLSKEQRAEIVHSLQRYFHEELDQDLSDMSAGFLLDYVMREIGPFAYNAGVEDAQKYFISKTEELAGTCFEEGLTYWTGDSSGSKKVRRKP